MALDLRRNEIDVVFVEQLLEFADSGWSSRLEAPKGLERLLWMVILFPSLCEPVVGVLVIWVRLNRRFGIGARLRRTRKVQQGRGKVAEGLDPWRHQGFALPELL